MFANICANADVGAIDIHNTSQSKNNNTNSKLIDSNTYMDKKC